MTTSTPDPSLSDLSARLARIERSLARLDRVLDQIPGLVATAADITDELAEQAPDLDRRAPAAIELAQRLVSPQVMTAGASLLDHLDTVQVAVEHIGAAPGMAAMLVDVIDELMAAATARGLDIEAVIRGLAELALRGAELIQSPEFRAALDAGLLAPDRIARVTEFGQAIIATSDESAGKAGLVALWRASRDPHVQRALDFGIRLLQRCGQLIENRAHPVEPS